MSSDLKAYIWFFRSDDFADDIIQVAETKEKAIEIFTKAMKEELQEVYDKRVYPEAYDLANMDCIEVPVEELCYWHSPTVRINARGDYVENENGKRLNENWHKILSSNSREELDKLLEEDNNNIELKENHSFVTEPDYDIREA